MDLKISQFTPWSGPLSGAEVLAGEFSGSNFGITPDDILGYLISSGSDYYVLSQVATVPEWVSKLFDAAGIASVDFFNRGLIDSSNNYSIAYEDRLLLDITENPSVDYDNRFLYDAFNTAALNWGAARLLIDESNFTAIDWEARGLQDSASNNIFNWLNANSPYFFGGVNVGFNGATSPLEAIHVAGGGIARFDGQTPTPPAATGVLTATNYYGNNTKVMTDPDTWLTVNIAGTDYTIPAYLP